MQVFDNSSNVYCPTQIKTTVTSKQNFIDKLKDLVQTSLRKEVKKGKEIWHCFSCDKKWEVTKKNA